MIHRKAEKELWGGAFVRLVAIARKWTKSRDRAQDLAQEALRAVFVESADPPRELSVLVSRAAGIMKGQFLNQWRADRRRQDPRWLASAAEQSRGLRRTPEDLAAARERKAHLLARLDAALTGDPLAAQLVRATLEGYDTAADQAKHLGKDIQEIRNARKRVARAVGAMAAAEGGAEVGHDWDAEEGASRAEAERHESESGEGAQE